MAIEKARRPLQFMKGIDVNSNIGFSSDLTPDTNVGGFRMLVGPFTIDNPAATNAIAAAVQLQLVSTASGFSNFFAPRAGSITGISVAVMTNTTGGHLVIYPCISNIVNSSYCAILSNQVSNGYTTITKDSNAFTAGQGLSVAYVSSNTYAPVSNSVMVYLELEL